MAKSTSSINVPAIVEEARENLTLSKSVEKTNRDEAAIDLKFVTGDQWNPKARALREEDDRPVLTFNKLGVFVAQISNNARRNRPSIKISRGDNAATVPTAKVYEGLVRRIQYNSTASISFDTGAKNMAACSMGAWRVTPKRPDPRKYRQELFIDPIQDALGVYWDPAALEYTRKDAAFCIIPQALRKKDYQRKYGNSKLVAANFFSDSSNPAPEWIGAGDGGDIIIAEYWKVNRTEVKLILAIDGNTGLTEKEAQADRESVYKDDDGKPITWMAEERKITQHFMNGVEELEPALEWKGLYIPIIPCWGEEYWVGGKRVLLSLIRFQRDPQQLYNFYGTTEAEMISDMPKSPWVGFVGQFKTKLADWTNAALKKFAFLEADAIPGPGGIPLPLPQRNIAEPPVQALIAGKLQANEEMKATSGQFDPSLGINKGDQSGVAIQQLRGEGDISTFHFIDNLARSIEHTGAVIVDLIPYYYDTQQEIEILGEDMKPEVIMVNTEQPHTTPDGQSYHHQLTKGKYAVTVAVGPSFATKREESFEVLMGVAKSNPEAFGLMADVIFQFADFEGADILVQRFKAQLPPSVRDPNDPQNQVPPEVQAKMELLGHQLAEALNDLKNKLSEKHMELETKKEIAAIQAYATTQVALIKAGVDTAISDAEIEAQHLQNVFDGAHDVALQAHAAAVAPPPDPMEEPAGQPGADAAAAGAGA